MFFCCTTLVTLILSMATIFFLNIVFSMTSNQITSPDFEAFLYSTIALRNYPKYLLNLWSFSFLEMQITRGPVYIQIIFRKSDLFCFFIPHFRLEGLHQDRLYKQVK